MCWISVEDSQPKDVYAHEEPGPDVLVYSRWGIEIARQWGCGVWTDQHLHYVYGITHWMPLPEAPEVV